MDRWSYPFGEVAAGPTAVGPDALVDEPMRHRHLMTSSPAAAAAASACWPGMTWP